MKLRRIVTAALVVASLGISPSPAFARKHHKHVVRQRVVVVGPRVAAPRVVAPGVVVRRTHRKVRRHIGARFIPLPAPGFLPVPPPFYRHNPF